MRAVLHLKLFHPDNDHYGLSPLEAAATAIDLHNTAAAWNKALLDNSARPSGALVYTAATATSPPSSTSASSPNLRTGFQGAANAGRPLLLEGGLDWKSMSLSPKDMDFIEARHVAAREIALALGVPPMLLGIPGDNTYSNMAEAQRIFWRQTVLPLVNRVATALSNWLAPSYGLPLVFKPDLDLLEALSSERDTLWARVDKASFLTTDEKRVAVGYPPAKVADDLRQKFRADQPRVPGGQSGGGQWTDGGGGGQDDEADSAPNLVHQIGRKPGGVKKELWTLTVRQFVSKFCTQSVTEVLPGEFYEVTIGEVMDLAKGGDARARTCKKLLERQKYRK